MDKTRQIELKNIESILESSVLTQIDTTLKKLAGEEQGVTLDTLIDRPRQNEVYSDATSLEFYLEYGNDLIYLFTQAFSNVMSKYYQINDFEPKELSEEELFKIEKRVFEIILRELEIELPYLRVYSGYIASIMAKTETIQKALKRLNITE